MEITNQHVDTVIMSYVERYLAGNRAASTVRDALNEAGVGIRPVLDHLAIRTHQVHERALEFEALGFSYDDRIGVLERDTWWGKVYRKPGFPPVLIDQAFEDQRGEQCPIRTWVDKYGDGQLHHVAVNVEQIERSMERLSELGLTFSGEIIGDPGSEFRSVYTDPEMVDGEPYTVFELVERRWGYTSFLSILGQQGRPRLTTPGA